MRKTTKRNCCAVPQRRDRGLMATPAKLDKKPPYPVPGPKGSKQFVCVQADNKAAAVLRLDSSLI